MEQTQWADRGQLLQPDTPETAGQTRCVAVSRLGSAQVSGAVFSIWVQLRGTSWVEAKEGKFRLRRGDWIAFEKDSKPLLQADRHGVCVGLTLSADALRAIGRFAECALYAGRGRVSRRDARIVTLRLWREAARRLDDAAAGRAVRCRGAAADPAAPGRPPARAGRAASRVARAARAAASARCSAACSARACTWKATATAWCGSANWPS